MIKGRHALLLENINLLSWSTIPLSLFLILRNGAPMANSIHFQSNFLRANITRIDLFLILKLDLVPISAGKIEPGFDQIANAKLVKESRLADDRVIIFEVVILNSVRVHIHSDDGHRVKRGEAVHRTPDDGPIIGGSAFQFDLCGDHRCAGGTETTPTYSQVVARIDPARLATPSN